MSTANPKARLANLQTASYVQLSLRASIPVPAAHARAVERGAHQLLAADRLAGEWFQVMPEQAIAAINRAMADQVSQHVVMAADSGQPAAVATEQLLSQQAKAGSITAEQLRAARALLRMPAGKLADAAGVSVITIRRAEAQDGFVRMIPATSDALRSALEAAGVEFVFTDDGGVGVRLRDA